jgi:IclR family acetate operon transcriptional repressor
MPIQSVDRAISILNAFSITEAQLGVTELSHRLGLHKSTVHRLLASLEKGGLVERDPRNRKYSLGIRLIELAGTMLNSRNVPQVVRPYLHYVADAVEELTYLAYLVRGEVLNVEQVPGPHLVQSVGWQGRRTPLHCTSAGKIFMAHMPEKELESVLQAGLARLTPKTITDPADLRYELERVREQGYATSFEELEEGTNALAVPISSPNNEVIAAIGVVGPSYRFTPERALSHLDVIRSVAREVSHRLGNSLLKP